VREESASVCAWVCVLCVRGNVCVCVRERECVERESVCVSRERVCVGRESVCVCVERECVCVCVCEGYQEPPEACEAPDLLQRGTPQ